MIASYAILLIKQAGARREILFRLSIPVFWAELGSNFFGREGGVEC